MIRYDKDGRCTACGLPGSGFVEDGVCECLELQDMHRRVAKSAAAWNRGERS